jgi:hypothetical protein
LKVLPAFFGVDTRGVAVIDPFIDADEFSNTAARLVLKIEPAAGAVVD